MVLCVSCTSIGVALLLLFVLICAISEGVRYRTKFFVFAILSAISATIFIPCMFHRMRSWKNAELPAWGARMTAKLLGVKYQLRGHENIVQDTGCVVLVNHQSVLDLFILAHIWSVLKRCTVISKKEVMYFGTFGLATWLWGTIFIDRRNVEEAQNTINSTAKIINDLKAKLLLFPEGTRHSGTSLKPFKKGAFHLAIASQTPLQPVVASRYYFLNDKLKKFDSGMVYVTILPAIPTKGLTKDDLPQLMEKAYEVMNNTFVESTKEVLTKHMESLTA